MHNTGNVSTLADGARRADRNNTPQRLEGLLKTGVLQTAILTSAGFPIIATDEKGIIQLFNAGAERMLGYAAAEVVNRKGPADIHDPQEIALRAEALSRELDSFITPGFAAMATKASRGIEDICELTCIRKDGTRFPAIWSVTALRDEYGLIVGYLMVGTDITQRKVADEELSKNAWRLRYATESARLTYVEADLVRGAARTPENFATVMGYAPPPEQEADISAGTRLLLEHVVPQDRLRVTAAHEEFLAGTTAGKVEYRVLGDDKVERWIETRWTVEFSLDGKPQRSFATNLDITERKHAEQEVRESEERYRTLLNSMDEGYCVIEMIFDERDKPVDWLYLEVNPAFEIHNGLHEATGKRIRELVPDLDQHWFEIYGKVALTGEQVRCVNEAKAMGGIWFDVYACRVGGAGSRKVAVMFNNITRRMQSEEALRQSHAELQSHAQELDRFNRVAVRRELRMIELKREINELHQKYRGAPRYPLEFEADGTGGGVRHIVESASAALNLMEDAVESRNMMEKLNAELRASEARFHVMAENIPQLAWMADADGSITWFNQRWLDFTGTTLEENLRAGWKAVHHPDYVDVVAEKYERHIREGREWEDTFPLRGRDGRFRWFLSRMKAIRDESGKVVQFFGTNTDVTDQRENEEALRDAMAVAEKANRAKSDFLSSMSHELRTPLNAILGFAQLMESAAPAPTPAQMRNLGQILQGGWYLLDLINEILDLAQIESGKMSLTKEAVSVTEVMLECRAMFEPQARKYGIGMTFPSFDVPGYVRADRTRVKQVLINLLSNAIKYNKPQGAVAVEWTLSPPDSIRVSVRDTGAGLAPEQLAQLFQPFNRLGKEAGAEEGTGIGLVTTKRLVELMGGAIGAESVVGEGSVFWFELKRPFAPQAALQQAEAAAPVRVEAPPQVSPGTAPRTVLCVEDNPANLELIEQLLARRPDLRLLSAVDGNAGIELTRAHQPQVILIDVNLPGINGIEVMRILRADPSTAHIPIVALSANALPRDIEIGIEAGFFNYLTKPIKVTQFMDALDVALDFSQIAPGRATLKDQP